MTTSRPITLPQIERDGEREGGRGEHWFALSLSADVLRGVSGSVFTLRAVQASD